MDRSVVAITWLRAWKIYWSHVWRAFLLAVVLSLVAGVLVALLSSLVHVTRAGIVTLGLVAFCVAFVLYVGAWSMKRALQVRYSDFSVDLLPADPASAATTPAVTTLTERQGLPVFWAMLWRGWLITFPVNLLATYLFKGTFVPTASGDWSASLALALIQLAVSAAAGTWALRIALKLDYGNWRLQLVPN